MDSETLEAVAKHLFDADEKRAAEQHADYVYTITPWENAKRHWPEFREKARGVIAAYEQSQEYWGRVAEIVCLEKLLNDVACMWSQPKNMSMNDASDSGFADFCEQTVQAVKAWKLEYTIAMNDTAQGADDATD